ncbi:hypothetical protein VaNZ11_009984 [Volvox africanus]|uniref:Uncharacterized protein n=1 Tax=Volvox africanus TaxID=51714 RepID=A0ABQ5S8S3_9CHLO|nr:hypothetical protein VaNZ11_009984 [Volvox africanus]
MQWWAATQRLRMAFELMQASSRRNNPGPGLTVLQGAVVIPAAMTAGEMPYRAVLLALFGLWLRHGAYDAGAEEVLALPGPATAHGGCGQLGSAWGWLGAGGWRFSGSRPDGYAFVCVCIFVRG